MRFQEHPQRPYKGDGSTYKESDNEEGGGGGDIVACNEVLSQIESAHRVQCGRYDEEGRAHGGVVSTMKRADLPRVSTHAFSQKGPNANTNKRALPIIHGGCESAVWAKQVRERWQDHHTHVVRSYDEEMNKATGACQTFFQLEPQGKLGSAGRTSTKAGQNKNKNRQDS